MPEFGGRNRNNDRNNNDNRREGRFLPAGQPVARPPRVTYAGVARSAARAQPVVSHDEGLRTYMLGVYNFMMLGVAFSGAVVLFLVARPDILKLLVANPFFPLAICLGTLGLSFFSSTIVETKNPVLGHVFFWTYALLWGLGLAPIIAFMTNTGHVGTVSRAFFIAASMFGAASVYGYTTKKDLSGWGPALCMLCWGMFAATILNVVVFKAPLFSLVVCYVTVILFTFVTAFETQMIKDMYNPADDEMSMAAKSIFGAFELYGSFMMIFSRLLRILWSLAEDVG